MGNNPSRCEDVLVRSLNDNRELNISTQLNRRKYRKHIGGHYSDYTLTQLPESVTNDVSFYEKIIASFNAISTIPVDLPLHVPHLCYLNLNHNCLKEVPESIALFFHLKELHVSHNCLTELPRNIAKMRHLSVLDISHNRFTRLPENIGAIPGLTKLNVSDNLLSVLPVSLGECKTLELLLATGNRFLNDSCEADSERLLDYLRSCHLSSSSSVSANPSPLNSCDPVFPRENAPARDYLAKLQAQTVATGAVTRIPLLPPTGSTLLDAEDLRHALSGLVVGGVLGDALGVATDAMSTDQAHFHYEQRYSLNDTISEQLLLTGRETGDWSSYSDVTMLVLDSLLHWAGVLDELDLAQRLSSWRTGGCYLPELSTRAANSSSSNISDCDSESSADDDDHYDDDEGVRKSLLLRVVDTAGFTERPHLTAQAVARQIRNQNEACSQFVDWDSCLPAAIICGIPRFHDLAEVCLNAERVCLATHADELCVAACVALATIVAHLLQGHGRSNVEAVDLLEKAANRAEKYLSDASQLAALRIALQGCPTDESLPHVYGGGSANADNCGYCGVSGACDQRHIVFSSLAAVSWCLRQAETAGSCWRQLVTRITRRGGRAAVTGYVCGAVLGARLGYTQLPSELLKQLRPTAVDLVVHKLNQLMDLMAL